MLKVGGGRPTWSIRINVIAYAEIGSSIHTNILLFLCVHVWKRGKAVGGVAQILIHLSQAQNVFQIRQQLFESSCPETDARRIILSVIGNKRTAVNCSTGKLIVVMLRYRVKRRSHCACSGPYVVRCCYLLQTRCCNTPLRTSRKCMASIDGRCLSVRLSVPRLTISRERKGIRSWNLAGRNPMTFRGRKVKVTRPINVVTENQRYLWNGKV